MTAVADVGIVLNFMAKGENNAKNNAKNNVW